jgi:hypothetical protein
VSSPTFADVPVLGGLLAGLMHFRIQAKVADELFRRGETVDVANCRKDSDRHRRIHPGDGEQSLHALVAKHRLTEQAIDGNLIFAKPIQFAQPLFHTQPLIQGQRLRCKPRATFLSEQVGSGALCDQMRGKY